MWSTASGIYLTPSETQVQSYVNFTNSVYTGFSLTAECFSKMSESILDSAKTLLYVWLYIVNFCL